MLNQAQVSKAAYIVKECINDIGFMREPNGNRTTHTQEEIALIGKMLCEVLNAMQDDVRFHAIKLPTKSEKKEFFGLINNVTFEDIAPEDDFIKNEYRRICPRCRNSEIEENHIFCKICGLKVKDDKARKEPNK